MREVRLLMASLLPEKLEKRFLYVGNAAGPKPLSCISLMLSLRKVKHS